MPAALEAISPASADRSDLSDRSDPSEKACGSKEALQWTVHLAVHQPQKAVILAGAALGVAYLAWLLFRNPVMCLFAAMVLMAATADFLFPIRYKLNSEGAELRNLHNWRRIAWGEVKKVYTGEREIKLSPLEHGGRREAFRGVLLHCPENRDEVLAFVRRHRDAAAARAGDLERGARPPAGPGGA
jgi:hypothetical protein